MNSPEFQILISCTKHENVKVLVNSSNLRSQNVIIVNQVEERKERIIKHDKKHIEIRTPTKGLSVSRNIALQYASANYCLLSDDDEVFVDDISNVVISAYKMIPDADIIIFSMKNRERTLGDKIRKLSFMDTLKISSWQISFKRESIEDSGVLFDPVLGAGTKNGAGEENKFLADCLKNRLSIYYVPIDIATVAQEESTWFHGYTEEYFFNRGGTTRYIYGPTFALLYSFYFAIKKRKIYVDQTSSVRALKNMVKGIYGHALSKKK